MVYAEDIEKIRAAANAKQIDDDIEVLEE